jgi:hypothetical protein
LIAKGTKIHVRVDSDYNRFAEWDEVLDTDLHVGASHEIGRVDFKAKTYCYAWYIPPALPGQADVPGDVAR